VILLSGLYSEEFSQLLGGPTLSIGDLEDKEEAATYSAGWTTGEPIAAVVLSSSKRSEDYAQFSGEKGEVRPGHTDLVKYYKSKGFTDIRGGGRSSYRSTISDVIGGSIARIWLEETFGTRIISSICQVGTLKTNVSLKETINDIPEMDSEDWKDALNGIESKLAENEIRAIDREFASEAADLIRETRIEKDSLGASLEVVAIKPPALVGEPLYQSLKVRLMGALGGLHAVQSCEVGDGHEVVARRGSENNDGIRSTGYITNSHGGLLGGMTTGMPLYCRVGFKPTSSIPGRQISIRKDLEEIDFELRSGRHDPCVGVRAGVTLESRMAIELANASSVHQGRQMHPEDFKLF
jgi:chorismate synthase